MRNDELQRRHENVPPEYYDVGMQRNLFQRMWHSRRVPLISYYLNGRKGPVLDIGCHGGYLTRIIHGVTRADVTGMDISQNAIEYARQRSPNIRFLRGDLQDTFPFPDGSFALVTAFDVLEHVPRIHDVIREVHRVLQPDGAFIVGVPRDTKLFRFVWSLWTRSRGEVWEDVHVHEFTPEILSELVEGFGFRRGRSRISHWNMYFTCEFLRLP